MSSFDVDACRPQYVTMRSGRLGVRRSLGCEPGINVRALHRMLMTSTGDVRLGACSGDRYIEVESVDDTIRAIVEPLTSSESLESMSEERLFHGSSVDTDWGFRAVFQLVVIAEHYHLAGWLQRYPFVLTLLPRSLHFDNDGVLVLSLYDSLYYSLRPLERAELPFQDPAAPINKRATSLQSLLYSIGAIMLHVCRPCCTPYPLSKAQLWPSKALPLLKLLRQLTACPPARRLTADEFRSNQHVLDAFEALHAEHHILDAMGSTPLIVAAACNNLPMVHRNLAQRRQKNFLGYTALATAVLHRHIEPIPILAEVEGREHMACGETALIIACKEEFVEAVQLLAPVEAGIADNFGETALMVAAGNDWGFIVRLLLAKECVLTTLPHHRCGPGFTALMAAGQANAASAFKLLLPLEYHISQPPSPEFPQGRTVRQWCEEFQSTDCLALLNDYERQHTAK